MVNQSLFADGIDQSIIKEKDEVLEDWDEYRIVQEMMSDIKNQDDFRKIQKYTYKLKESIIEDPILMNEVFPTERNQGKEAKFQQAYTKFQTGYVEKCKALKVLPLPIFK